MTDYNQYDARQLPAFVEKWEVTYLPEWRGFEIVGILKKRDGVEWNYITFVPVSMLKEINDCYKKNEKKHRKLFDSY